RRCSLFLSHSLASPRVLSSFPTRRSSDLTLITWGEERIDSGLAAILMAVMPLVTLVLAHFFTADERITARKAIGVTSGMTAIRIDRKSTRLNSSHVKISYAVFCLKKKKQE